MFVMRYVFRLIENLGMRRGSSTVRLDEDSEIVGKQSGGGIRGPNE